MTEAGVFYSSNIALCVFNVFFSYTAIMLNSVTIYAMRRNLSMPRNLKTLLLSLAVSDLGVGLIVQPLYIATRAIELEPNFANNPTHKTISFASLYPSYLLVFGSFFGVTALTVDRFLAIHLHLRYNELVTHKRVVAAVISVWVFSAFLSLIRFLVPENALVINATVMAVCLITTAALYWKIYLAVRHHTSQIHAVQLQEAQNDEIANAARLRKSTIATFYVYLVFLVCYLPHLCMVVAVTISASSTVMAVLQRYAITLVLLNSSLNPLVYCWKMSHIRHAVMDILRKILSSHN